MAVSIIGGTAHTSINSVLICFREYQRYIAGVLQAPVHSYI